MMGFFTHTAPPRAGAAAGLVIRARDVEILALAGKRVTTRVRVPIEAEAPQPLATAIQKALGAASLTTRRFAVSIPSQDVLFRFFTIPMVPKAEYEAAVQFEARKYIPFKTDLLVWDFRAVPSGAANKLEVIFAAIPRESFRGITEALTAAGIQPTLVEPRSLSLARLVEPVKAPPAHGNEFLCVVDVEQDSAHLSIVRHRMPYLTRDVDLLPSQELPAPPAAPATAEEPPLSAVDPKAQRLLSELSVSMDFFIREHPSTAVSRVVLFGDEQLVGPWCRWLSEQLRCPVELGNAALAPWVESELPLASASAVGLLRAVAEPATASLDFLTRSVAKAPAVRPASPLKMLAELLQALRGPKALIPFGVAGGCLVALGVMGRLQVAALQQRLAQMDRTVPGDRWGLEQMDQDALASVKGTAAAQLAFFKEAIDRRVRVAAKLDALAKALPNGVWLTGLEFDDQFSLATGNSQPRLVLQGSCYLGEPGSELSAIQELEQKLKHHTAFFSGFEAAQLDQVTAQVTEANEAQQRYTYRTFQFNCSAARRL